MYIDDKPTTKRGHARRVALMLLVRAFPGRVSLMVALAVLGGALPAAFAALVAMLVVTLPAAVKDTFDSASGHRIIGILAAIAVVLVVQETLAAVRGIVVNDLYRRYDEYLLARVMRTTLSVSRLELFE